MYLQKPVQNKLLTKKWRDYEQKVHTRRLGEMKSSFQIEEPPRYRHLEYKSKKHQLIEGKLETNITNDWF